MEDIKTAFVLITDEGYFQKAKKSIIDLRTKGLYQGDIVLITINFNLNQNFKDFYSIIEVSFPEIDKSKMMNQIKERFPGGDGREFNKLNQWEKLHVFDEYFLKWDRIVFIDSGLRILDTVQHLLDLDYKNCIIAPNDAGIHNHPDKVFKYQISHHNPELVEKLTVDFGKDILESQYLLNCIWIYDTSILKICDKYQLINAMNEYPLCKTNEMVIMNLLFHFKYKLWKQMPDYTSSGKYLFEWCELNHRPRNINWREICYIKYPITITFEDT